MEAQKPETIGNEHELLEVTEEWQGNGSSLHFIPCLWTDKAIWIEPVISLELPYPFRGSSTVLTIDVQHRERMEPDGPWCNGNAWCLTVIPRPGVEILLDQPNM